LARITKLKCMSSDILLQYIKDLYGFLGGYAESARPDVLEAILPPAISVRLNLAEYLKFYFDPQCSGIDGQLITYESDILETLGQIINDQAVFSQIIVPDIYLKKAGFETLLKEQINFVNVAYKLLETEEKQGSYLQLNFKYTAISEEKKEGLLALTFNEHTFSRLDNLAGKCGQVDWVETLSLSDNLLPAAPAVELYNRAIKQTEVILKDKLLDFQKSLNHRRLRDVKRLKDYYGDIMKEIKNKIARKKLANAETDGELARLDFTQKELNYKISDQKLRYQITVKLKAFGALRMMMPVVALKLLLRRKKLSREFILIWNPLLKTLELPVCSCCQQNTSHIFLAEDTLENLCPHCKGG